MLKCNMNHERQKEEEERTDRRFDYLLKGMIIRLRPGSLLDNMIELSRFAAKKPITLIAVE